MSINKRHIAVEELLGLFLSFTPRPHETELFRVDMRLLNPTLLSDSIKECAAASGRNNGPQGMLQRDAIHGVYTRKIKELAALYPFVFSVENALRHTAAEHYGRVFATDTWWTVVRDKFQQGEDSTSFATNATGKKNIRGIQVTPRFVKQMLYCFEKMHNNQLHRLNQLNILDEFYLEISLRALCNLIEADWTLSRGIFVEDNLLDQPLRKQDMSNWFKLIIDARNELFHGKPIGDLSKVTRACEAVLDKLGIHLEELDSVLASTKITRTWSSAKRSTRHILPPSRQFPPLHIPRLPL